MSLGFGRLKLSAGSKDGLEEGSIIFHGGQKERIVNLDETDGNLDNTKGKRGGQPPLVFYGKDIAGSSTAASKRRPTHQPSFVVQMQQVRPFHRTSN